MKRTPQPPLYPPPRPISAAEEAADISLGRAKIAQKAARQVVDALPIPDPRDDLNFQRFVGLEQGFLARISPRRNRWPELAAIDELIAECDQRQEQLRLALAELRGRRQRADAEHAVTLAAWMNAGSLDPKPIWEAKALDESIVEASADHLAIDHQRDRVLEERIAFVAKHRKRLVRDAERETERMLQRYLELVDAVEQTREDLVGLRATSVWAAIFPHESLVSTPPSHALVGGRRRETEHHLPGLKAELPAHSVLGLLRADARYFATVSTLEQAAALKGVSTAELKGGEAMWAGSDADLAWRKREREKLIAAGGSTTVDALKLLDAQRLGLTPFVSGEGQ